ncbi:hypothetical protein pb186bvf_014464 [Paramecium bursaria]
MSVFLSFHYQELIIQIDLGIQQKYIKRLIQLHFIFLSRFFNPMIFSDMSLKALFQQNSCFQIQIIFTSLHFLVLVYHISIL